MSTYSTDTTISTAIKKRMLTAICSYDTLPNVFRIIRPQLFIKHGTVVFRLGKSTAVKHEMDAAAHTM